MTPYNMVIKNSDLKLKVAGLDTGSFSHYLCGVAEVTLTNSSNLGFLFSSVSLEQ